MSDYQSHQTYQAPTEQGAPAMPQRYNADVGGTSFVTSVDGKITTEQRGVERISAAELNPRFNDGTVFETARSNLGGIGVREIKPDTLLTIDGVQATCKSFEAMGLIHRDAKGEYQEGSGVAQEPPGAAPATETEGENADAVWMTTEEAAGIDLAFEGVSDQDLGSLMASGIAVSAGQLDMDRLVDKVASATGLSKPEASAQAGRVQAVYQTQADNAVMDKCGIAAADLPAFWDYCKTGHLGALRGAINQQVHQHSMAGYRALASRFMADNPPPLAAVIAAGHQTRTLGALPEVYFDGHWMLVATAARLGHI